MKRFRFTLLSSLLFFGMLLSFCGCIKTVTDTVFADGYKGSKISDHLCTKHREHGIL